MAVADVAVRIGPRNTRRLTTGAIGLGVLVAIVAAVWMIRPAGSPGRAPAGRPASRAASRVNTFFGLVYGLSRQQVLRKVGQPTKRVGSCWEYRLNAEIRGGRNMLNALRLCFEGGGYSYQYSEIDGTWLYPTDPLTTPSR